MTRIANTYIYKLPVSELYEEKTLPFGDRFCFLYAPLNGCMTVLPVTDAEKVISYIVKKEIEVASDDDEIVALAYELTDYEVPDPKNMLASSPGSYTTLSLMPNYLCNFHCTYCYSAAGRGQGEIEEAKLKATLDFFINENRIKPQPVRLFISGGGEPLMSIEKVKWAVKYARQRAVEKKFPLRISLITNGSLLTENVMDFLEEFECSVCISFEVLPELQTNLRGSYDTVRHHLIKLGQRRIPVLINSTIIPKSVEYMGEMTEKILHDYPFVHQFTMEPVTDVSQFASREEIAVFYRQFALHFKNARKMAEGTNTVVWFSGEQSIDSILYRFCPGKLCLTANGTFSICHCATSPKEERYHKCSYGRIDNDGKIIFDEEKFRKLLAVNADLRPQCTDCIARWHCGGECMTRLDQYPAEYMEEVCRFNRSNLLGQLIERLDSQYMEELGCTLREAMKKEILS